MTRRMHGSRAARRDEALDRLLEAVERILAEGESYTEISVERLAKAAGISRSTFYVHFEDKGDLLRSWFARVYEELEEAAGDWWAIGADATRDELRAALAKIIRAYRPHTPLMAALYDAASYDAAARDEVEGMMGRNIAGLRAYIRRGQKEGFIDASLLPAETAGWLSWMAERAQHQIIRTAPGDAEVERQIDAYTDIVWKTLYAGATVPA